MTEPRFDLLVEPLLNVRLGGDRGRTRWPLPRVLAALSTGDQIESFEHLQAHQSQPWYCFLCQLAAMALARADREALDGTESWDELLLGLTDGRREPWCLVVPDLSEAAFFQPPVPEGELSALGDVHAHPDDLDVLVTAKNHDVKLTRITHPSPGHWIYALVSLQTMEGYSGRGNYGVVRMSSGYSCRPFVGMAPGLGWGERFRRDVDVLLDARDQVAEEHGYDAESGLTLAFLPPWDGESALPLEELDPYFLEVCRRVRLEEHDGLLRARRTTSGTQRVDVKEASGNVGDPWIPVARSGGEALNVTGSGFSYELIVDILLTGEYRRGVAARIRPDDPGELYLVAQALSRGQGGTDGLHERIVPIPGHVRRRLLREADRETLAERAETRTEFVSEAWTSALRPALCALFQGDPGDLDFRDNRPRPWRQRLDQRIDRIFFPRLWEHADLSTEEADGAWRAEVLELGAELLEKAIRRAAVPEPRRFRGWAGAERIYAGARKRLMGAEAVEEREETG